MLAGSPERGRAAIQRGTVRRVRSGIDGTTLSRHARLMMIRVKDNGAGALHSPIRAVDAGIADIVSWSLCIDWFSVPGLMTGRLGQIFPFCGEQQSNVGRLLY
jgi:hypothetical protein